MKQRCLFPRTILRYRVGMRLPRIVLMTLALVPLPAHAGATGWQELGPDARVRIVSSDRLGADGRMMAAIEIDMPQGTKTYWRVPGETGIPTTLDLAGSTGITGHEFFWPYPQIETQKGFTDFVYYGPTVIPFALDVDGDAPVLRAALLMGICSDICVPAMADFTLPIDLGQPDPGQDLRIAQAMALTPIPWDGAAEAIGPVRLDADGGVLWVELDPDQIDPASVIIDASRAGHIALAPQKSQQDRLVGLRLVGGGSGGGDLVGQSIDLVFMTRSGPYMAERRVERSTSP